MLLQQLHYIQAEELFPQLFQLGHLPRLNVKVNVQSGNVKS